MRPIEESLQQFITGLQGTPYSHYTYGGHNKSVGQAIYMPDGILRWAQVAEHKSPERLAFFIQRLFTKDQIPKIQAPQIFHLTSEETSLRSLCLMSFVESPTFSNSSELQKPVQFENQFLQKLHTQLQFIASFDTPYTSCRQDLIIRRIHERYGSHLPTTISYWATIHGDLHWANLTRDCTLLDWEGWGKGPQYLDVAFLYGYSVAMPEVCAHLEQEFPYLFKTSDGLICLLFVCSELLRMIELYADHPHLKIPLETVSKRVLEAIEKL